MTRTLRVLFILVLAALSAQAGIVVTFDQPSQTAQWGDLLVFTGVITYNPPDTGEIFLNFDDFINSTIPFGTGFTLDDLFLTSVPVSLLSGGTSGDIELFRIQVNNPSFGHYSATYQLLGGVDGDAQAVVADANFDIQVVPEPATFVLLTAALASLILLRRASRRF